MSGRDPLAARIEKVAGGRVLRLEPLAGGSSRQTMSVELEHPDGRRSDLVAQRHLPGATPLSLRPSTEAALVDRALAGGVPTAPVHTICRNGDEDWVLYGWVEGETHARRLLGDERYGAARSHLASEVGAAVASIQAIPVAEAPPELTATDGLGRLRMLADGLPDPHPAFEAGFRWLEATRPVARSPVIVHGDLRMGNLIVDEGGLAAVIDWELAHIGHPAEDLGWFCVRSWRFGSSARAGGVGTVEQLLAGYRSVSDLAVTADEVAWWEAYGTLRWGLITIVQAHRHLDGHSRSVDLASVGRRTAECEWDLLELMGESGWAP